MFFVQNSSIPIPTTQNASSLPGRLGSSAVYHVRLGTADMYFYMSPAKESLIRDLIPKIQDELIFTAVSSELEFSVVEVTPCATTHLSPNDSLYDGNGVKIFKEYTQRVMTIFEDIFQVQLAAPPSWNFNLIYSQDNMKYHQDQFDQQYRDLQALPLPLKPMSLVQDITLSDLDMSVGTFSATIFQPQNTDDRFVVTLYPGEVVGTLFVESISMEDPSRCPEYPGAKSLPIHAPSAPMDESAIQTVGSAKGKRISTLSRSIVETEQFGAIARTAIPLTLEIGKCTDNSSGKTQYSYNNGVIFKQLISELPEAQMGRNYRKANQDGVEIYVIDPKDNTQIIQILQQMFGSKEYSLEEVQVFRLVKKGTGFSFFANLDLNIQSYSQVVFINRSTIPAIGYKNYHLADLAPAEHRPWIHLYPFFPSMALQVPVEVLPQLALTPIEEILFRDGAWDIDWKDPSNCNIKIVTELDVFIFTSHAAGESSTV